jgi:hypothetical protein
VREAVDSPGDDERSRRSEAVQYGGHRETSSKLTQSTAKILFLELSRKAKATMKSLEDTCRVTMPKMPPPLPRRARRGPGYGPQAIKALEGSTSSNSRTLSAVGVAKKP